MIIVWIFCFLFSPALLAQPQNELSLKPSPSPIFRSSSDYYLSFKWSQTEWSQTTNKSVQKDSLVSGIQNEFFNNRQIFSIHLCRNLFQFLEFLKGGAEVAGGLSIFYDDDEPIVFPIKAGGRISLNITQKPTIKPFISAGYALWGVGEGGGGRENFSSLMAYWSAGLWLSFSLFKPSLRYTLVDEYGLKDLGITFKINSYYSAEDGFPKGQLLISVWNLGVYFSF